MKSSEINLEVVGITKGETFNHLPTVFTNVETWQSYAFAAPGSDNGLESPVAMIALQGKNIDADAISSNYDFIETVTKSEAVMGMPGYKEESSTIYMMLAFLFAISAVIIAVFFYVFILQKTQQFGVMKAIGASNSFIKKSIISQVFVLSLISIIVRLYDGTYLRSHFTCRFRAWFNHFCTPSNKNRSINCNWESGINVFNFKQCK